MCDTRNIQLHCINTVYLKNKDNIKMNLYETGSGRVKLVHLT